MSKLLDAKPRDIFGLAVRLLGLVFLYRGLTAVPSHLPESMDSLLIVAFRIGWPLWLAYWLFGGAPWIMRLAYPDPQNPMENP